MSATNRSDVRHIVLRGDALEILRGVPDATADAVVTDPPAGISFMGKAWDGDKGGREAWIAWLRGIMVECQRVLKPGGHALVWALPRTSHWTATAVEDAGFEIRDVGVHLFGTGFPKSLNVSKAIDAAAGAERTETPTVAMVIGSEVGAISPNKRCAVCGLPRVSGNPCRCPRDSGPATPEAARWDGWGTALKPAAEHWILARKPLEGTVAANVLAHGCGALNVDGCRIGGTWDDGPSLCDSCVARAVETRLPSTPETGAISATSLAAQTSTEPDRTPPGATSKTVTGCSAGPSVGGPSGDPCGDSNSSTGASGNSTTDPFQRGSSSTTSTRSRPTTASRTCSSCGGRITTDITTPVPTGRWPSNLTLDEEAAAELDAQSGNRPGMSGGGKHKGPGGMFGAIDGSDTHLRADTVGASRFFYVAKPSTREREEGLDHLPRKAARGALNTQNGEGPRLDGAPTPKRANHHPTVKSIALMRWLVRLITPPGGLVLDPFCGSGSTGCAAVLEGMSFVGIDQDPDSVEIARARIAHWGAK